ncbi:MAG: MFS transporter [Bacteroidales bacterium]|nr:MFS transporter [Bacteroidales bacterium]
MGKTLRDSAAFRWLVLVMVSLTMFSVYLVTDQFSPLKTFLEIHNGWDSAAYGWFSSSYSMFNVFLFMLIIGGVAVDKFGIRIAGLGSCLVCLCGIAVQYWAMTSSLEGTVRFVGNDLPAEVFWSSIGYALFGVGSETAGVAATKVITKWFKGYEMALAMGAQVALARLGQAGAMVLPPFVAEKFGAASAVVMMGLILVSMGTVLYLVFMAMDKRLDGQLGSVAAEEASEGEEEFRWSDFISVFKNPAFWMIALLCVLFYSAVFPFQKYATDLMVNKFGVSQTIAGTIPAVLPFGCIFLTPLFGSIYDTKGHGADLMILGAGIITLVHVLFAMPFINQVWMAYALMALLGIGFALLPSALWPSVAKIIPAKQFGTAMSLTFYIQNIGLWGVPLLIGTVLAKYCITGQVTEAEGLVRNTYDYTIPSLIFALFGLLSIAIAIGVKVLDKKKNYHLQEPNIQK